MHPELPQSTATRHIAVMDTTLRDGEQTPHVAYSPAEKLQIARMLLDDVGVDRIEVASAGASDAEGEAVERIVEWARSAGQLERIEVLGFCDGARSPRWIAERGARRMNLLTKGSEAHCRQQLLKTPAEHFVDAEASLTAARSCGVVVAGAYLEDFSRGFSAGPAYVFELTERLLARGVQRVFLADTLGCLAPTEVDQQVRAMIAAFPSACFEFHAHDDYGLATANGLAAVAAGVSGVHTSVNGLGERAGNARLCELVMALHDHGAVQTSVREAALCDVARWVERCSGKLLADNAPIVGRDVFTQTAGIHADGDRKGELYASRLDPARLGRRRSYALGKLAGRASLDQNLDRLGIVLGEEERTRLLQRVVALGDRKQRIEASELRFLIDDLRGCHAPPRVIRTYSVTVLHEAQAEASLELLLDGRHVRASARGVSSLAALVAALQDAAAQAGLDLLAHMQLDARVLPGGLFETAIVLDETRVIGVDADHIVATVAAIEKLLQLTVTADRRS